MTREETARYLERKAHELEQLARHHDFKMSAYLMTLVLEDLIQEAEAATPCVQSSTTSKSA